MNGKTLTFMGLALISYCSALTARAAEVCHPPEGLDAITSSSSTKFVFFGETHGSNEAPSLFAESVCAVAMSGKRTLVGLEFPELDARAFQQFLESGGSVDDATKLITGSTWAEGATRAPDGRTSEAMFRLMQRLRALRAAGLPISITAFQRKSDPAEKSQTPYEMGMAASLLEAAAKDSYDLVLILVGNNHASKAIIPIDPPFEPMAMHLPKAETLTLRLVHGGGSVWSCQAEGCGIHKVGASGTETISGIVLEKDRARGYDGVWGIASISGSPPFTNSP